MTRENTVVFENARIIFRNFTGKEGKYNREGDRNFCVLLEEEDAQKLEAEGWNVRSLKSREEGDPDQPYMPVSVSFRNKPPKVVLITSKGRTTIGENEIEMFDWVDIRSVDFVVRAYDWSVNGRGGVKAYLKSIFVTIEEDRLDLKYADLDQIPARAGRVDE